MAVLSRRKEREKLKVVKKKDIKCKDDKTAQHYKVVVSGHTITTNLKSIYFRTKSK